MLRHAEDGWTLLLCLAMPGVTLAMYGAPGLIPWLCPVACYLAMAAGLIAHNHQHCATFRSRGLNEALSLWLSAFQGHPTFAWVAMHNLNHHRLVNREGDATITWRYSKRHTAWTAATALFTSKLGPPVFAFMRKARARHPARYRWILAQYSVWVGWHLVPLGGALALLGLREGLKVWLLASALPTFFVQWSLSFLSYIQHVHADPWSEHDHSRSFTGKLFNLLTFNLGFHTAHHERPGAHWSTLPAAHARVARHIHPELQQDNFLVWCFRSYVLAIFAPRFGTQQIGRAAYAPPPEAR